MAAVVFRSAERPRPCADVQRRQFRPRPLPRSAAKECQSGLRLPAIARHPDPQDGSIWAAAASENHDWNRSGNGNRGGRSRGIHGCAMSTRLFDRVAVIGIGLIGSSLARALRRDSPETSIVACARRAETLATVRRLAIADEITNNPAEAAKGADLVVLATPLSAYEEIGRKIGPVLKDGAILSDVGSVKQ